MTKKDGLVSANNIRSLKLKQVDCAKELVISYTTQLQLMRKAIIDFKQNKINKKQLYRCLKKHGV